MPSSNVRSGGQSRADVRWVCRYLVVGGSEGWVESRCRCVRIVTVLVGFFSYVCRLDVGQHCWYLSSGEEVEGEKKVGWRATIGRER